jgi:putative OPT family oligopeptide transporter
MTNPSAREPHPFVTSGASVPEVTLAALLLGSVLTIVMGAANAYLGLYAGMTVSASIPAAVVSMGLLRGLLRRGSILENNIVQTMASTGESLAAGAIFTIPALVMIGVWQDFQFWPTTLIVLLGGVLGVLFMIPMRRALIRDRPDLVYPEGVACSQVLIAGEEGGSGLKSIVLGLCAGALFKFTVSGVQIVQATVEGAFARGRSVFYGGADMSVALLAVGYIVNLRIALLVALGGALGWIVAIPLLGGFEQGAPVDHAWDLWNDHVRFIGVGAMVVGGLSSIWEVRGGILRGLVAAGAIGRPATADRALSRLERDIPGGWLIGMFLATMIGTFLFYDVLLGSYVLSGLTVAMTAVASFLLVAVATYIAGLVGSSNSPVSGMTICALLLTSGVLVALGVSGESAILATLGVAGVVCCATCTSGDIAQDLKTGLIVGATPRSQQWVQMVSAIIPAFFFAPVLSLLHHAYGIGTGAPGALRAPQAALFASLTDGFFGETALPWAMIQIGVALGLSLIVLNQILAARGVGFRAHVMPVAVGVYLPVALVTPILVGGFLRHAAERRKAHDDARSRGVLFASGLIAGEALMGIGLAVFIALQYQLPIVLLDHPLPSVAAFAGVVWLLRRQDALKQHDEPRRPGAPTGGDQPGLPME